MYGFAGTEPEYVVAGDIYGSREEVIVEESTEEAGIIRGQKRL